MDMILTGRPVGAEEALRMGLVNRLVAPGRTVEEASALGEQIAAFPQRCLRSDRLSLYEQWDLPVDEALVAETRRGLDVIRSGETRDGAERFSKGAGRHGEFD